MTKRHLLSSSKHLFQGDANFFPTNDHVQFPDRTRLILALFFINSVTFYIAPLIPTLWVEYGVA